MSTKKASKTKNRTVKKPRPRMGRVPVELHNVRKSANDRLSEALADLVPAQYKGTDRFLDLVFWNLRYFNDKDPVRVETIAQILSYLNADIFVFEAIYAGAMDEVASRLGELGAGYYSVAYETTGGQQRVCFM